MIEWIKDQTELDQLREKNKELLALFFYADFSDAAKRALPEIEELKKDNEKIPIYGIDVSKVKGVHKEFGVKNVPTVVTLRKGKDVEKIEGVQSAQFYTRSFTGVHPVNKKTSGNETTAPKVVVYSTPTCPACNSAKAYFRRKGVRFRDIDVSRNQQAAESLVRRSGQMAVPQIDINGQLIVGFDQAKIDRLIFH